MLAQEINKPSNWQDFETLCHALNMEELCDPGASKFGRPGQSQTGIDILAQYKEQTWGIQCKRYKNLDLKTIEEEIRNAENGEIEIDCLVCATTADADARLQEKVHKLSQDRVAAGKFRVIISFWDTIQTLLYKHPRAAQVYAPGLPGTFMSGQLDDIKTDLSKLLSFSDARSNSNRFSPELPDALKGEVNRLITSNLDESKEFLLKLKPESALKILNEIRQTIQALDVNTQFRWHTNYAAANLLIGNISDTIGGYKAAYGLKPDDSKSIYNRIHAAIIEDDIDTALDMSRIAIAQRPDNPELWSIWISTRRLAKETIDIESLPEPLAKNKDVLYALYHYYAEIEDTKNAELCAKKAWFASNGESFDCARIYISSLLLAVVSEPEKIITQQIDNKTIDEIQKVLHYFPAPTEFLSEIKATVLRKELANNLSVAHFVIGQEDVSRQIMDEYLKDVSDDFDMLRLKLSIPYEIEETRNFLRRLSTLDLNEEDDLVMLALQSASNIGDVDLAESFAEQAKISNSNTQKPNEIDIFRLVANLNAGDKDKVLEIAQSLISIEDKDIMLEVALAHALYSTGDSHRALDLANSAAKRVFKSGSNIEYGIVFDLVYDLEIFDLAATIGEKIHTVARDCSLTYRYTRSLIYAGNRSRAGIILDSLPDAVASNKNFRSLRAKLLSESSDWGSLELLLREDLDNRPNDANIFLNYCICLYRQGKNLELTSLFTEDRAFPNASPHENFEIAKLQLRFGEILHAYRTVYHDYRCHPESSEAAGYLLTVLLLDRSNTIPQTLNTVEFDSAVTLANAGGSKVIVIEGPSFDSLPKGAHFVSSQSPVALSLLGKSKGEEVVLHDWTGESKYMVDSVVPAIKYLAGKASKTIAESAEPTGPVYSMNLQDARGELDPEPLLKQARNRSNHVKKVFASYQSNPVPISILAKLLNIDVTTLWREWPLAMGSLFVSSGTHTELFSGHEALRAPAPKLALDICSLCEIVILEQEENLKAQFPALIVPQSTRDSIQSLIEVESSSPESSGSMFLGDNGKLIFQENSEEYHKERSAFFQRVLNFIDSHCSITPAFGPDHIPHEVAKLEAIFDKSSYDTALCALTEGAVLVSDDGVYRTLMTTATGLNATWSQPILNSLYRSNTISRMDYSDALLSKIRRGHSYVSVDGFDISNWIIPDDAGKSTLEPAFANYLSSILHEPMSMVAAIHGCLQESANRGKNLGYMISTLDALTGALSTAPMETRTQMMLALFMAADDVLSQYYLGRSSYGPCVYLEQERRSWAAASYFHPKRIAIEVAWDRAAARYLYAQKELLRSIIVFGRAD